MLIQFQKPNKQLKDTISEIKEKIQASIDKPVLLHRTIHSWDTISGDFHDGSQEHYIGEMGLISRGLKRTRRQLSKQEIGPYGFYPDCAIPVQNKIWITPSLYIDGLKRMLEGAKKGEIFLSATEFYKSQTSFSPKSRGSCLESISLATGEEDIMKVLNEVDQYDSNFLEFLQSSLTTKV
ncbi:MAG: hypothetical protein AABW79_01730 [Nanoarchaeota archaeon]